MVSSCCRTLGAPRCPVSNQPWIPKCLQKTQQKPIENMKHVKLVTVKMCFFLAKGNLFETNHPCHPFSLGWNPRQLRPILGDKRPVLSYAKPKLERKTHSYELCFQFMIRSIFKNISVMDIPRSCSLENLSWLFTWTTSDFFPWYPAFTCESLNLVCCKYKIWMCTYIMSGSTPNISHGPVEQPMACAPKDIDVIHKATWGQKNGQRHSLERPAWN